MSKLSLTMFEIDTHANLFCCLLIIALNLAQVRSMQVSKKQILIFWISKLHSHFFTNQQGFLIPPKHVRSDSKIYPKSKKSMRCLNQGFKYLEAGLQNLRQLNCSFMTISSHFSAIYINIFHKTEVQTVILRC